MLPLIQYVENETRFDRGKGTKTKAVIEVKDVSSAKNSSIYLFSFN